MRKTLADKQIKGRPVEVCQLEEGAPVTGFEIVFIARSQADKWKEVVRRVGTAPVLTVGECEGFAHAGGHINFTLKDQKVRLEVNLKSASAAGLKISSKMAAMATVVSEKGGRP